MPSCVRPRPRAPLGVLVLLGLGSCGAQESAAPRKPEEPARWVRVPGPAAVLRTGITGRVLLPEIMGGGAALLDCDHDGDLDLFLVSGGDDPADPRCARDESPNSLWLNDGHAGFTPAPDPGDLTPSEGYGMGVCVADLDGDGWDDLYLTQRGRDRLLLADGAGRFRDATEAWGLRAEGWSSSATAFDLEGDGDLDLFVTRYLEHDPEIVCRDAAGRPTYCPPKSSPAQHDLVLRNDGERFVDVSAACGVAALAAPGLGVVAEDLDGDGRVDVLVANDGAPNHLWHNLGDGRFEERAFRSGAALNQAGQAEAGMGVVAEDLDGDGTVDLFLTHLAGETHTLYRGGPTGFRDRTGPAGLFAPTMAFTGFGVAALDLELDGDLDLVVAQGRVSWGPAAPGCALPHDLCRLAEPGAQLLQTEPGRFEDDALHCGDLRRAVVGRGLVSGDLDGDGAPDLVRTALEEPPDVLLDRGPRVGSWLRVDTVDGAGRRRLGTRVELRSGERSWSRSVRTSDGYQCARDPRPTFGVPGAPDPSSLELRVRWPDGSLEVFPVPGLDREAVLVRGAGRAPAEAGR